MFDDIADDIEFAGARREHVELSDELTAAMSDALTSRDSQAAVGAFEREIAARGQRAYAIAVGSGTDALFFALAALGIGPGDEVLAPDMSFIASASAILRTGATPVFVDIDATCCLDLARAAEKLSPRTRAMVVVQMFGAMQDPVATEAFAARHRLAVVEDAAHSFGARHAGRPAGSVGAVSALSFDAMKVLSAPTTGGAVLTNDPRVAARVRRLRYHGREDGAYLELGYNSQLSALACAALSVKLRHVERWRRRRCELAAAYAEALSGLPLPSPEASPLVDHAWHKFTVQSTEREQLRSWLAERKVPTRVHYPSPFHREGLFGGGEGGDAAYPFASRHADRSLTLPLHAHLSDAEVEHILGSVRAYFQ